MVRKGAILLIIILALAVLLVIVPRVFFSGGGTQPIADEPLSPDDLTTAVKAGSPVICTMDTDMATFQKSLDLGDLAAAPPITGDYTIKGRIYTKGALMRMEISFKGSDKSISENFSVDESFTFLSDGSNFYINVPLLGDSWYAPSFDVQGLTDSQALADALKDGADSGIIECRVTDRLDDSLFQLPPGAKIVDIETMIPSEYLNQ